jgi:hypothetical protein
MSIRTYTAGSGSNTYSHESEIDYIESKLAEIMTLVDLDPLNINTITVDDIILSIRSKYPFTKNDVVAGVVTISPAAASINNINLHLVSSTRRLWWRYQIAKNVRDNA